jgi:hypothetical protein
MSRRAALVALGFAAGVSWLGASLTAGNLPPHQAPTSLQAPAPPAVPTPDAPVKLPTPSRVALSDADTEQFLLKGEVLKSRAAGKGITGSLRATLTHGTLTHDAHVQMVDESKREFRSKDGTEFNFRDSWTFNVAAYRIDRLIGLGLVPVSVERRWKSTPAAYSWWLDDVLMDEGDRLKTKISPPDFQRWNASMQMVRLFDQLIANTDRNLGNLMITNDWSVWAIDHTRAFRTQPQLKTPGNISRCDRQIFARLKQIDKTSVKNAVGSYLQTYEIDSLLKRRDEIVEIIEKRGDNALFDWTR